MNKEQFVSELGKLRSSATFLTLHSYRNEFSEIADYSIVFHMNYEASLKRSVAVLQSIVPEDAIHSVAKQELMDSYKSSLNRMSGTSIEELDETYTYFYNESNKIIKGIKLHPKTNVLHLYGLVVHKRITMPGMYPARNRRELTIAKDNLRKSLPINKFRQFKITPAQVDHISVENISLLPPE